MSIDKCYVSGRLESPFLNAELFSQDEGATSFSNRLDSPYQQSTELEAEDVRFSSEDPSPSVKTIANKKEGATWAVKVEKSLRKEFSVPNISLLPRTLFLSTKEFARRLQTSTIFPMLLKLFKLPYASQPEGFDGVRRFDKAPSDAFSDLDHRAYGFPLSKKILQRLTNAIKARIKRGFFVIGKNPFDNKEQKVTPRELIARSIAGLTSSEASISARRILVQVDNEVATLIHEACHFYAHPNFNARVKKELKGKHFDAMETPEILLEGVAEFFTRELMKRLPKEFGELDYSAYQSYFEVVEYLSSEITLETLRKAYFGGQNEAITKLFAVIDAGEDKYRDFLKKRGAASTKKPGHLYRMPMTILKAQQDIDATMGNLELNEWELEDEVSSETFNEEDFFDEQVLLDEAEGVLFPGETSDYLQTSEFDGFTNEEEMLDELLEAETLEAESPNAEFEDFYEEVANETFAETEFADFEDELAAELDEAERDESVEESETAQGLSKKLNFLSLLPHVVETSGTDTPLTPSIMDPGIYDGPQKYKIAPTLQQCLQDAMKKSRLGHVRVALVDLTKSMSAPEFAGYYHKDQKFAASTLKIVPMLAAFQLRHDLRHALKQKGSKTLIDLFLAVRDDWAATQLDPKGKATPFTAGISLRGKLVLVRGVKIGLIEPKAPHLETVFANAGSPVSMEFNSTGESFAGLQTIVKDFNKGKRGSREALNALGFLERMKIMVGGDVPASNFATYTVVRDVGYLYMVSTLLQSGLYDTNRNGGLWLGARYGGNKWRGALAGGAHQSATAGSMAAFLTLIMQDKLVSPVASQEMRDLLQKVPHLTAPGTGSWYQQSLSGLAGGGSLKRLFAKVGLAGGADECAFIEREIVANGKSTLIRYVVVALRANNGSEIEKLVRELDKCILANNGLTPTQGGHPS